ncbi:DUF6452 family protein [Flavobacterium luminosum]|uniref:DUF6452 family protein n=1 Tax=Flavobacterium luminosum TaxID=2949086 RepID=A0ABT0TMT8_9FLAO|nr:DUF6452 family protein [Flavobacterium sp. HXWNR70]MCL9808806.1 DUF6452 family protein [Flavobacterium sp. HXWNR70]
MKKILFVIVFVFSIVSLWNCEKDDICEEGTPTTPQLVIEFYDNNNPTALKSVSNLKVIADGEPNGIVFDASATDNTKYHFNGSKLKIPLKTIQDFTNYSFTLNDGNAITSLINEDKIAINYTRNDIYISRACGFKTVFTLNDSNGVVLNADANNWIKEIAVQTNAITTENEVHVKIFF